MTAKAPVSSSERQVEEAPAVEASPAPGVRRLGWDLGGMAAIGLLGLLLRLGYAVQYAGHPLGQFPWVDEGAYWTRDFEILGGGWLPGGPFYQDSLFPYVLAGLMKLVGRGWSRCARAGVPGITDAAGDLWGGSGGIGAG